MCVSRIELGDSGVSPGLNEVRGAHDDEQQSARPGARREARIWTCVQTPQIIKLHVDCEQETNNNIFIIAMLSTVCSTFITVKSA